MSKGAKLEIRTVAKEALLVNNIEEEKNTELEVILINKSDKPVTISNYEKPILELRIIPADGKPVETAWCPNCKAEKEPVWDENLQEGFCPECQTQVYPTQWTGTDEDNRDDEKLYCPYCGEEQTNHSYDEEISSDMISCECQECGRYFWYSVNVTRTYDSTKD